MKKSILKATMLLILIFSIIIIARTFAVDEEIAYICKIGGNKQVFVKRKSTDKFKKAIHYMPLFKGDKIDVKKGANASVMLNDGKVIDLKENESCTVPECFKEKKTSF